MPPAAALVDLGCTRCRLSRGRKQVVPGEGSRLARLVLVGEAPGPDEDRLGRPFIGRAGKILRTCLEGAKVPESEVWITNVVKCFPFEEEGGHRRIRKPAADEAESCRPWLSAELATIAPKLIVAVGLTAAQELTGRKGLNLSRLHGTILPTRPELGDRWVFLTFHPAGLRYGNGSARELTEDLRNAYALVASFDGVRKDHGRKDEDEDRRDEPSRPDEPLLKKLLTGR